jgi:sugar (pentulose or hexulose) kinase
LSQPKYIVSIDAGTSKIKVVIFDDQGREIVVVIADNRIYSNHIRSELNMNELWENTAKCIRKAIATSGIKRDRIQAAVISGQGEGCWAVDAEKKPLRRAILWNDGRAAEIVEKISEDRDLCKEIKITTGSYPRAGSTIILLKWLKEKHPEEYAKIKYCISCKDWLRYKLTSAFYCEITDASTSYLNIHTNKYPKDIFAKLGISGAEERFPELILPTGIGGYVTKKASAETLLPCGLSVAGGMLDIVSTSVGTGAINVGDICTILGTSCINEMTTDKFVFEDNRTGWERHIVENRYVKVAGAI